MKIHPLKHQVPTPSAGACFKGGGDGGHGGVTPEGSRHFGAEGSTGGAKGMMDNPVIMFDMILHSHNIYIFTYMIYIYIYIYDIYIYLHI